jgi:tetratricopeptide (TPR) repeat protein
MKKVIFPLVLVTLLITLGFVYKKYDKQKNAIPQLKERAISVSAGSEWLNTKQAIEGLLDKLRRNPSDNKAKIQLAMAYIQESRVTGDHAYYDEASLKLIAEVLAKEPQNLDALNAKTTVLLSQHHFAEALKEAQNITTLYPDVAFGYGLLCDAYVELGQYSDAVKAADKQISMRPDLRSYARVSYLREIHGDYEGAKLAMESAVKSGVAGMEQTEWCRVQLGKLYEATGNLTEAENHYQIALSTRPNYAYALMGMGRLACLNGKNTEGVEYFEKAKKAINDPAVYEELTEAYMLDNQRVKAEENAKSLVKILGGTHDSLTNHTNLPEHGHYADKELAEAYLKINDLEHALVHATLELQRRPDNIDVNEVMAWVYYKSGDNTKALLHIEKALKTGSQKASLLWKAGNIYAKNNQEKRGNELINKALKINKYLRAELL